jgi:hypothetical protein
MDASTKAKKRKSEPLAADELSSLRLYRERFNTEVECAISIGIDRLVLNRVMLVGSGSPDTIKKIKKLLRKLGTA